MGRPSRQDRTLYPARRDPSALKLEEPLRRPPEALDRMPSGNCSSHPLKTEVRRPPPFLSHRTPRAEDSADLGREPDGKEVLDAR